MHDLSSKQGVPTPLLECAAGFAGVTRDIPAAEELYSRMELHTSLKKGMGMNKNRFAKRVAVAAGFFFLYAAPALTRAQSTPPTPTPPPRKPLPAVRPKKPTPPPDDFAGFQYTDEQQARIDQIHQDMKSRTDAVVKDEKLTAEQRDAMLAGYQRMERSQVFKVLNSQQRKEVLRRIRARHAAEQAEQNKQSSPK